MLGTDCWVQGVGSLGRIVSSCVKVLSISAHSKVDQQMFEPDKLTETAI